MKRIIPIITIMLLYSTLTQGSPCVDSVRNDQIRIFKLMLSNEQSVTVSIFMIKSGIHVIGYDGDELRIESKNYTLPSLQKQGLKSMYNKTQDNSNIGLSVVKNNNLVTITQASIEHFDYTVYVPNKVSVKYEEVGDKGDNLTISNVSGEIEVKVARGNVSLKNVAGPVTANSTNGNLTVIFSNNRSGRPCAMISTNGFVDITLLPQDKSSVKLRSVNGEVFTDFDIDVPSSPGLPAITGGHDINGKINGGGPELIVRTVNNNIFVRKRK